ncbi:hypothetical protein PYCC9005_002793 [Savitreella phatthalungensis]
MSGFAGLPALTQLQDTISWNITVRPFIPEFWQIRDVFYGTRSIAHYYLTTNPVIVSAHLAILFAGLSWILSESTGNYSWVDRSWSLVPTIHVCHYWLRGFLTGTGKNGLVHARLSLVAGLYILWSIRLTRNYYLRGGYTRGHMDYRYKWLQSVLPRPIFFFINLFGVSVMQNALLAALAAPAYVMLLVGRENKLNWRDALVCELVIFALTGQLLTDDMHQRYQHCKVLQQNGTATHDNTYREFSRTELDRGFVTSGLFAYSRHPAWVLEMAIFAIFYAWATVTAAGNRLDVIKQTLPGIWLNWTGIGFLGLVAIFQASTRMTEHLTAKKKYPGYDRYRKLVPMLLPIPGFAWREPVGSAAVEKKEQ